MTADDAAERPFSWVSRADGTVLLSYHTAPVAALRGRAAERFLARVAATDEADAQHLMARATARLAHGTRG
ncbi:MAG: hypothetical protein ACXWWQ_06790 [Candidatus Limnocylindria bacterium]